LPPEGVKRRRGERRVSGETVLLEKTVRGLVAAAGRRRAGRARPSRHLLALVLSTGQAGLGESPASVGGFRFSDFTASARAGTSAV